MRKIISSLVLRPLVTKLILVFIVVGSILSFHFIERNSYPPVDLHTLDIKTFYPDASPEDVEINITSKIEQAILPMVLNMGSGPIFDTLSVLYFIPLIYYSIRSRGQSINVV
jgi:Cu/Ag efflux pump CusA